MVAARQAAAVRTYTVVVVSTRLVISPVLFLVSIVARPVTIAVSGPATVMRGAGS